MTDTHALPKSSPDTPPNGAAQVPSLHIGDRLTQPEFHRRYEQVTGKTTFELIGGIVYMASPLHVPHGSISPIFTMNLGVYKAATPGIQLLNKTSTRLGGDSEVQPDISLRILPAFGGRTRTLTNAKGAETMVDGGPELVIEIAHTSAAIDTHAKRTDYLRAGVPEYCVAIVDPPEWRAWHLPSDSALPADGDGIWRSRVFPGLWIDPTAVFAGDSAKALAVVQQGIAGGEHADFVAELQRRHQNS